MSRSRNDRPPPAVRSIVVCHEADRCGATTLCMHIAAALLAQGQNVATVEFDASERALTGALVRRRTSAVQLGLELAHPTHIDLTGAIDGNSAVSVLEQTLASIEGGHDFVILDASRLEGAARRLVYSFADTLVMPFTLPLLDLALDTSADPEIFSAGGFRDIAWTVREARRERRVLDGGEIDWVVLRNRMPIGQIDAGLPARLVELAGRAAMEFGFRTIDGLSEREAYRGCLDTGLTVFDRNTELMPLTRPGSRLMSASLESWSLIEGLKLPINPTARRKAAIHAQWTAATRQPVDVDELLVS
jgi:chromosome partitioning protein